MSYRPENQRRFLSWALTRNLNVNEIYRKLNFPETTLATWTTDGFPDDEFARLEAFIAHYDAQAAAKGETISDKAHVEVSEETYAFLAYEAELHGISIEEAMVKVLNDEADRIQAD